MQTLSISVQTLCVPCACHCRYCLLSWNGKTLGADYARSEAFARRFHAWVRENRPDLTFYFTFGYSMEHPDLGAALDFAREIGSPAAEFLQCDGLRMRNDEETESLLRGMQAHGVKLIDLTVYGTREYHDRFAARPGDFDYLMRILAAANRIGLGVEISVPVTRENAGQMNDLVAQLKAYELQRLFLFVPHAEGRGATLDAVRFSLDDLLLFNEETLAHFNRRLYKTPAEWAAQPPEPWEYRALTLSLTPENIDRCESTPFAQLIEEIEQLDDQYHAALPAEAALYALYADPDSRLLYSRRDLLQHLQRRYIAENGLQLYDIHDERYSFVRRV